MTDILCCNCSMRCEKIGQSNCLAGTKIYCCNCYLGSEHQKRFHQYFSTDDFCDICRNEREHKKAEEKQLEHKKSIKSEKGSNHVCEQMKKANAFTSKPELYPLKIEKNCNKEVMDAGFFWELEVHADEFPEWVPIRHCPFCGISLPVIVKLPEQCHPGQWENHGEYSSAAFAESSTSTTSKAVSNKWLN